MSLQGYKYGYQPLPKYIPHTALDERKAALSSDHRALALVDEWYQLDEGARPEPRFVGALNICKHIQCE